MLPACGGDLERRARHDRRCRSASSPAIFCGLLVSRRTRSDAEVAQDLRADAVVAQVLLEAELEVRLDRVAPAVLQRVGADLVREPDAASLLVQVDEHAAPGRRRSARAPARAARRSRSAREPKTSPVRHSRVQPHEHVGSSLRTSPSTSAMCCCWSIAVVVDDGAERRRRRAAAARASATRRTSVSERSRMLDDVGDGDDAGAVRARRAPRARRALARLPSRPSTSQSTASSPSAGEAHEVARRLGQRRAHERCRRGATWIGVTWPGITRSAGVASGATAARIVVARSAALMPGRDAAPRLDRRAVGRRVAARLRSAP